MWSSGWIGEGKVVVGCGLWLNWCGLGTMEWVG